MFSQSSSFESKFEEQKIPEWYDLYLDYAYLKTLIGQTKLSIKCKYFKAKSTVILEKKMQKLSGYYELSEKGIVQKIMLDDRN